MEPFKPKDNRLVIDKDTLADTLRSTITKKKKPVKFTWKGAADLLATMSNTPLRDYQLRTLMQIFWLYRHFVDSVFDQKKR